MLDSTKLTPGVDSARRALQILLMFGEEKLEITVDDVVNTYQISLPSAYRYLALLRELHLVQDGRQGGVILTPRLMELASAAERSLDLERVCQPVLDHLMNETQETAFVLKRVRDQALFVASAEPDRALTISFRAGKTMPLHRAAVAKVLLAFAPASFRDTYLTKTIPDAKERAQMVRQLDEIMESGRAESLGEVDDGIWGCAVPVRVGDIVVASISIAGPAFRIDERKRARVRKLLVEASREIMSSVSTV